MTSRPNFFIPYVDGPKQAERVWQATKAFLEDGHGWPRVTERRIFRLVYERHGEREIAQIGEPHREGHPRTGDYPLHFDDQKAGECVVAILENEEGPYLVCTHNRGVIRGDPILVGINERSDVVYFAGFGPDD